MSASIQESASSSPEGDGACLDGAVKAGLAALALTDGEAASPPPPLLPPACADGPALMRPGSTVAARRAAEGQGAPPEEHAWGEAEAAGLNVRAAGYRRSSRKEPSLSEFYQLVAFDLIKTDRVVDHIARGMALEPLTPAVTHPALPPLFVCNCQLPDAEPAMFGGAGGGDGPSRSAVFIFAVRPETVADLSALAAAGVAGSRAGDDSRDNNKTASLRLLVEYFRRAPTDPEFRGRFKVIASCRNIESLELPSFISNYNGKPVLITKSGSLWQGHGYVEMDIRVHRFSFLAKKGLHYLKPKFASMVLDVAFLVEGRDDAELPERVLGSARLHRLSYDKAAAAEGLLPSFLMTDAPAGGINGSGRQAS